MNLALRKLLVVFQPKRQHEVLMQIHFNDFEHLVFYNYRLLVVGVVWPHI